MPRIPALAALLLTLALLSPKANARSIHWGRVMNANPGALSSSDRARAARLMNQINVYYGCSDTVANCLATDQGCQTARRLAGMIVRMVKMARSDARIKRAVRLRSLSVHPFKTHRFNLQGRPRFGATRNVKVTVVEFADFECPFCRVISPVIKRLVLQFKQRGVSLVYKHFPVSNHTRAMDCARASYATHKQGIFWKYHDLLYRKSPRLSNSQLETYAREVGVNMTQFRGVRDSHRARLVIAADKREGLRAGAKGTPTFFFNGKLYRARKDYDEMKDRIEEELHLVGGGR